MKQKLTYFKKILCNENVNKISLQVFVHDQAYIRHERHVTATFAYLQFYYAFQTFCVIVSVNYVWKW
jgi:hypothetical protein